METPSCNAPGAPSPSAVPKGRASWLAALATGVCLLCAGAGFWTGRYTVRAWPKAFVEKWERSRILGGVLRRHSDIKLDDFLEAYSRPDEVRKNLDRIVWAAPMELHPYLDGQPRGGAFLQCFINAAHMRNRNEPVLPKPPNTLRVFLTGGSVAFGAAAPTEAATIGQFLEDFLAERQKGAGKRVEVFTAACIGWTTTHERILIENRLARLEPDLVVSLSGFNDVLVGIIGEDCFEVRTQDYLNSLALIGFSLDLATGRPLPPPEDNRGSRVPAEEIAANLLENLTQSARRLSGEDCPLLFALQPCLSLSAKKRTLAERRGFGVMQAREADFAEPYRAMAKALEAQKVENLFWADLTGVFDSYDNETMFTDTCHVGDKGNRVIAKALADTCARILDLDRGGNGVAAR